ncbi:MAG TPA: translation elongation factor Ts [Nevskiaceae bacterium]|nr:translation elongation factor Ts [Nevskiaceae bacterium]
MKKNLNQIKKLRDQTKAGVIDCRQALRASGGDLKKAKEWLKKKGIASAGKRSGREAKCGVIETYSHNDGQIVSVVELNCETDFVARTNEFKKLAHELAMQMAAMNPKNVKELLVQPFIRDEKVTIEELIKETIGKVGENIVVSRVARFELGKQS